MNLDKDQKSTVYQASVKWKLKLTKGFDIGAEYPLIDGYKSAIGRLDCDIPIDKRDSSASRKHAIIEVKGDKVVIKNLSKTNGTLVNQKVVKKGKLKNGDRILIGDTEFLLNKTDVEGDDTSRSFLPDRKILYISTGVFVSLFLMIGVFKSFDSTEPIKPEPHPIPIPEPKDDEEAQKDKKHNSEDVMKEPVPINQDEGETTDVQKQITSEDKKKSQHHLDQGIFDYKAGRIRKAYDEFKQSTEYNPYNTKAETWLAKTREKIESLIQDHYEKAIRHKKYLRYREAYAKFNLALKLIGENNAEHPLYKDVVKSINELKGKL